jgi:DNA-binding MarR family transcriptional regulator
MSDGTLDQDGLVDRVGDALKVDRSQAHALLDALFELGLVEVHGGSADATDAGRRLFASVRSATAAITERLWGDLPAEDLATAGRVLSTVLERANAELAGA